MKIKYTITVNRHDYKLAMRAVCKYCDEVTEIFSTPFHHEITFTCGIVNWFKFKRFTKYYNLDTEFC